MELLDIVAMLVTLTALFAYLNERFLGLPTTVGVMVIALIFSLLLLILGKLGIGDISEAARQILGKVDLIKLCCMAC